MLPALALSALSIAGVRAWGNLGHETVGYVAMAFLADDTLSAVKSSLGSTYNESLGVAATWADDVKHTAPYEWSADLHFIDAEDNPTGGQCSVSQSRDCSNNFCILTAISNYTTRIQESSLSKTQLQEALKFLDHFLGDIGQPLHVEAFEVGGNDIDVTCNAKSDNLHAVWDTGILETNIDANFDSSVTTYANSLISRINTGDFASEKDSWITCASLTSTQSSRSIAGRMAVPVPVTLVEGGIRADIMRARASGASFPELKCPLIWAQEANAFDCSEVFNFSTGDDLCKSTGAYYKSAVPIIDLQLAKQGYRLAEWLNLIFDGSTDL